MRPLGGLVVDVLHVFKAPDAHHLDAVRLERALPLRGGLCIVGRAERDALHAEMRERGEHAAERSNEWNPALLLHPRDQLGLTLFSERVARRRVREHHDLRRNHREKPHVLVEVRDLAAIPLHLTLVRARYGT